MCNVSYAWSLPFDRCSGVACYALFICLFERNPKNEFFLFGSNKHRLWYQLFEQMLKKFLAVFPTFTDHTLLHTLSVTNISNQLLRENVMKLNASEIYIYLMACALHDIGMGVSDKDIGSFIDASGLRGYVNDHPEISKPNLIRKFHNDFSSQFVKKYWELLEIPSEQYANAIAEVGRGHRKTDLMDENLYPTPGEFATEARQLLTLKLEHSVG